MFEQSQNGPEMRHNGNPIYMSCTLITLFRGQIGHRYYFIYSWYIPLLLFLEITQGGEHMQCTFLKDLMRQTGLRKTDWLKVTSWQWEGQWEGLELTVLFCLIRMITLN